MKELFRKIFSPVLNHFEQSEGEYNYKESHRIILIVVGILFLGLSSISIVMSVNAAEFGGIVPIIIFLAVGSVCEIVGLLGSDRAVANLWRSR